MELEGTQKSQKQMERTGTGKNLKISKIDGKKWNWKEPVWKEMELERKQKTQKQLEGTGTGRNLEISKIDGKKWNQKESAKMKNTRYPKKEK